MHFNGPEQADLVDVYSLNSAFLEFLRGPQGKALRQAMPARLQPVVAALTKRQLHRLANVPFLLLTLNESDEAYWSRLLIDTPNEDLFAADRGAADPLGRITAATLGFLWQLSRRNAYATRLVSGASLSWCEQLASCTFLSVLQCAALHQDMVQPRLASHAVFWQRLLGAGLSSDDEVRRAAHLTALQTMLIPFAAKPPRQFRTAACHSSVPSLKL